MKRGDESGQHGVVGKTHGTVPGMGLDSESWSGELVQSVNGSQQPDLHPIPYNQDTYTSWAC